MSLLFETIKIQNGKPQNVEYHIRRVAKSREILFGMSNIIDFVEFIDNFRVGEDKIYKLKVVYNQKIMDYQLIQYSIIQKNEIIFIDKPYLNYALKYLDRRELEEIELQLAKHEIGIITKNGYLTDVTYANVVLFDGINYVTPAMCLLEGTKRAKLISEGKIIPKMIHINDLHSYKYLQIINSMIDLEDKVIVSLNP